MAEHGTATRIVDGVELPAAGVWKIDPSHAEVGFIGRHFMLTKVRGRFTGIDGVLTVADAPEASSVQVTIDMTTVNSGDDQRDTHLKSADFFDVESHRMATFKSTQITWRGTTGSMTGDLVIKDVSHPVELAIEYVGAARDPWENDRAVFSARGKVNREDWNLTWNMPLASGGLLVSKEIEIEIEIELVLQS